MHDPETLIRGLQVGLGFLKCLDEDEHHKYPIMGITIKHVQNAIDYLDDAELHETPEACPSCLGDPCIVDDREKDLIHVGCRQAFVSRDHSDEHCKDRPTVMCMPSKRAAISRWNSWVAEFKSRNQNENKEIAVER